MKVASERGGELPIGSDQGAAPPRSISPGNANTEPAGAWRSNLARWLRRLACCGLVLSVAVTAAQGSRSVPVGVFGLFRPHELTLRPDHGSALQLTNGRETIVIEGSQPARLHRKGDLVLCKAGGRQLTGARLSVTGIGAVASFWLGVPSRIERRFEGLLEVTADPEALRAVVTMPRETAVASVVAAESPPGASFEALKAQAVVTRSYLAASRGRHNSFAFCDTTHCQYLREPPPANHPATAAAAATRGLVLTHRGHVFGALFSRSCGGSTRSLIEIGLTAKGYPFYALPCAACRRHPEIWQRKLEVDRARPLLFSRGSEAARLEITRKLGWNSVPSNRYRIARQGDSITLHGRGIGHGVGLCQLGAAAMAVEGADFGNILGHYFPNTTLLISRD